MSYIYQTAGVAEKTKNDLRFKNFVDKSIRRHLNGDYGDTCVNDTELNKQNPLDSMSTYIYDSDCKIWVKQEQDIIIVLFPSEY